MRLVVGGSDRQLVAAVVLHRVGVPLDPDEADVVMPVHAQEATNLSVTTKTKSFLLIS